MLVVPGGGGGCSAVALRFILGFPDDHWSQALFHVLLFIRTAKITITLRLKEMKLPYVKKGCCKLGVPWNTWHNHLLCLSIWYTVKFFENLFELDETALCISNHKINFKCLFFVLLRHIIDAIFEKKTMKMK